jgi:uncharacterized membrane protein YoaK (UPF0700 family)
MRRQSAVRDALLVALTVAAGAVDAISYLGLGGIFTANMTGNMVLLALAAGSGAGAQALRAGVSLVAFSAGVFVSARLIRTPYDASIWPRRITTTLTVVAVLQGGVLAGWLATSAHPSGAVEGGLIALSALAMGAQGSAIRTMNVSGVSTTYLTGTLVGLVTQVAVWTGARHEKVRRASVLIALLAGAAVAAVLLVNARSLAPILPVALTVSVVVVASVAFEKNEL